MSHDTWPAYEITITEFSSLFLTEIFLVFSLFLSRTCQPSNLHCMSISYCLGLSILFLWCLPYQARKQCDSYTITLKKSLEKVAFETLT